MINLVALGLLFSSLGAVMVLNPQPCLLPGGDAGAAHLVNESEQSCLHQEDENPGDKATDFGSFLSEKRKDVSEAVEDIASQAAGTVKDAKESVKQTYSDAKQSIIERAKETMSYMPNAGEGVAWSPSQKDSKKVTDEDGAKTGATYDDKFSGIIDQKALLHCKVDEFCQWFYNETLADSSEEKSLKERLCIYYDGTKERVENLAKATAAKYDNMVDAAKRMGGNVKETVQSATEKVAIHSDNSKPENVGTISEGVDTKNKMPGDYAEKDMLSGGIVGALCSRNWTAGVDTMKHTFCSGLNTVDSALSETVRSPLFRVLYLLNFSAVYGASLWVTFVSGYVLSKSVPRHQFGFVQSKIFPVYLRMLSLGTAMCVLFYSLPHLPLASDTAPAAPSSNRWQHLVLLCSLLSALLNTFTLEPKVTKVMVEKLKLEKEEGRGHANLSEDVVSSVNVGIDEITRARMLLLDREFGRLHNCSSLLNMVTIMGLTWHLWYLASRVVI